MTTDPVSFDRLHRIDRLCDQFESEWSSDRVPLLKRLLDQLPSDERRNAFAELMKVDAEICHKRGGRQPEQQLRGQFPEYADVLSEISPATDIADETLPMAPVVDRPPAAVDPAPTANDESPRRFGRFVLSEELGRGTFGAVWKAHDPTLDRSVALKLPRFENSDRERVDRFLNEARIAANLHHPNIVAVWERGQVDGQYYISSEFVPGQTLQQYLKTGALRLRQAVQWIRDLAGALHYAHQEQVIHRDIKPANVMITKTGRPMLMDFGLARRLGLSDGQTVDGTVLGTPAYMSPEQARGDSSTITAATDQYSLGAVFYLLLTNVQRWEGDTYHILQSLQNDPPPPDFVSAAGVPADLQAICQTMLQPRVVHRYADCGSVVRDLDAWLEGRPVSVRRISSLDRFWRWASRNQVLAASIATVGVILMTSLVAISAALVETRDARNAAVDNLKAAEFHQRRATKERNIATSRAVQARRQSSRNSILLAADRIRSGRFQNAEQILLDVAVEDRGWLWRMQYARIPETVARFPLQFQSPTIQPRVFFHPTSDQLLVSYSRGRSGAGVRTSLVDANTGQVIHEVAPELPGCAPYGDGFSRSGRYVGLMLIDNPRLYPSRMGVWDLQTQQLAATLDQVAGFVMVPLDDHTVLAARALPNGEYEYVLWNFVNNETKVLGRGPQWFPFNFSVDPGRRRLLYRHHGAVEFPEGVQPTRYDRLLQRLSATDFNADPSTDLIAGRLIDQWPWNRRGRIVPPGHAVVVRSDNTMTALLEPDASVTSDLAQLALAQANASPGKWEEFRIRPESNSVTMAMWTTGAIVRATNSINWWRLESGEFLGRAEGIALHPDGNRYAGFEDGQIVIRKMPSRVRRFQSAQIETELASWHPITPASRPGRPAIFYADHQPWIISPDDSEKPAVDFQRQLIRSPMPSTRFYYRQLEVVADESGTRIALMVNDEAIEVLSLTDGSLQTVPLQAKASNGAIAFRPGTGELINVDRSGLHVRDLKSNSVRSLAAVRCDPGHRRNLPVTSDGRQAAIYRAGRMTIVDLERMEVTQTIESPTDGKLSFSSDGRWIATGSKTGTVRIWKVATGNFLHSIQVDSAKVHSVFHPTEPLLLVGCQNGRLIAFDAADWSLVMDEELCDGTVDEIVFSRTGKSVAIGIDTGWTRRWFEFSAKPE